MGPKTSHLVINRFIIPTRISLPRLTEEEIARLQKQIADERRAGVRLQLRTRLREAKLKQLQSAKQELSHAQEDVGPKSRTIVKINGNCGSIQQVVTHGKSIPPLPTPIISAQEVRGVVATPNLQKRKKYSI